MNTLLIGNRVATDFRTGATALAAVAHPRSFETSRRLEDKQHEVMRSVFARTGGCVSEIAAARHLSRRSTHVPSTLMTWIVKRTIVSFPWRSHTQVPLFQFCPDDMSPRREVTDVVCELSDVFDDWELAVWFAQSNSWLEGMAPAEIIAHDPAAVHATARADRYIARGY